MSISIYDYNIYKHKVTRTTKPFLESSNMDDIFDFYMGLPQALDADDKHKCWPI